METLQYYNNIILQEKSAQCRLEFIYVDVQNENNLIKIFKKKNLNSPRRKQNLSI